MNRRPLYDIMAEHLTEITLEFDRFSTEQEQDTAMYREIDLDLAQLISKYKEKGKRNAS